MIIETRSAQETYELGLKIGKEAKKGQVYTMVGDLGVGKTVFTQGMAHGLGIKEPISSPTFTIVQVYDDGRMPFYHFDVYRIGDLFIRNYFLYGRFSTMLIRLHALPSHTTDARRNYVPACSFSAGQIPEVPEIQKEST